MGRTSLTLSLLSSKIFLYSGAIVFSLGVHLFLIYSTFLLFWRPVLSLPDFFSSSKKTLEVELYNYRVHGEILKKISYLEDLAVVGKPEEGVEDKLRLSLDNPEQRKVLRAIKDIFLSFWQREEIGELGRSVVVFEVSKGRIQDFFIQEWEGTDLFLEKLLFFLKKLHSLQIAYTGEKPLWFECEFSVEPAG
ncbi:MAG TPA: hypothetical protein DIT19_02185 [Desulfonauticus sp.]|jgi:hypothetical protein|nr:MAG: hypothetical protein XD41_0340 [Desulfonauticus sp. 38_4375]MDK2920932.1 hypothetical protein [Desulfonauticus sp.]HCO12020.1 hypothetical protein [Desulfonauticus sp.]